MLASRVTVGSLGLCCCVQAISFECCSVPVFVDFGLYNAGIESDCRQFGSLLLCSSDTFRVLFSPCVC